MPRRLLTLFYGLFFLGSLPAATPMTLLPAADPRFRYEGRFDRANPAHPVVIWAGDRIGLDFDGADLTVVFGAATGKNFFNITVDGATEVADASKGRFAWSRPLAPGRHRLEIFKRSEADAGHVAFHGVELATGAQAWAPAAPAYKLRVMFIGDSITAGACNEDGAEDQWDDRRTHNHALSYGFLTSAALGADHRAVAVSGMGICEGYVPMVAGDTWNKLYPRDNPARADLSSWVPDVVCLNFGENDDSFTRSNQRPFPEAFTRDYVALVKAVRATWPKARLVVLRGGMWGGAHSPVLRPAWEAAVRELEAGDAAVSHFVFNHWTSHHPRVRDDRAMADELITWLQAQPWLASGLENTK